MDEAERKWKWMFSRSWNDLTPVVCHAFCLWFSLRCSLMETCAHLASSSSSIPAQPRPFGNTSAVKSSAVDPVPLPPRLCSVTGSPSLLLGANLPTIQEKKNKKILTFISLPAQAWPHHERMSEWKFVCRIVTDIISLCETLLRGRCWHWRFWMMKFL